MSKVTLPLINLRSESEVMSTWDVKHRCMVTFCCATYNHEDYILDAFSGFVNQITSFPFKILIRDDCSVDDTSKILLMLEEAYPNILEVYREPRNRHKEAYYPSFYWADHVDTPFLALCEGDDLWVSKYKIQNQLSTLLKHQKDNVVCSVGGSYAFKEEGRGQYKLISQYGVKEDCLLDPNFLVFGYVHTSTYLLHTHIFKTIVDDYFKVDSIMIGDTPLRITLSKFGHIHASKNVYSIYRMTGKGSWSSLSQKTQYEKNMLSYANMAQYFDSPIKELLIDKAQRYIEIYKSFC